MQQRPDPDRDPHPGPRPTSRTVTAYARGLYLAQVFQLAVAAIAIIAVLISGYFLNEQRKQYAATASELEQMTAQSERAARDLETRIAVNVRLTAATVAMSEASPDDPFNAELAYTRTVQELQGALESVPEAVTPASDDPWHETRQTLRRMMAGALTSARRLPEAIAVQQELVALEDPASPAWARYSVGLAALHCKAGDNASALEILTAGFREAHTGLLADTSLADDCGLSFAAEPAATPATREGELTAASTSIRRLFLHIREPGQRRAAANLAERLCAQGFSVDGIELVAPPRGYPESARAIYYYPDQAADAATVSALVQNEIAALGLEDWRGALNARLYQGDNLPRDQVEIWFAPAGGVRDGLGAGVAACRGVRPPGEELTQMISDLNAGTSQTRLAAGQLVANALRTDQRQAVIAALIHELESPQVDKLTATGRFNILYQLNTLPAWEDAAEAARLSAAIAEIETRATAPVSPVAIGGQTRDCLDKLKTRLSGGEAPGRCGGR